MDKFQINKFRMYGTIDLVLDSNSELFANNNPLKDAHQRLKAGIKVIGENRQVQEADNSGLTKNKRKLREKLIQMILHFSGALQAYATSIKDVTLKTKANYVSYELKKTPDPLLYDIGVLLRGLVNPIITAMAIFYVDEKTTAEMDDLLVSYKLSLPRKRAATSVSKVSTANISDEFDSMDNLLKDEIDSLMLPFQLPKPDFYKAYKNGRLIVGYTGPKPKTDKTNKKPKPLDQPEKDKEQEKERGREKETER